jgi:hypothetical protein
VREGRIRQGLVVTQGLQNLIVREDDDLLAGGDEVTDVLGVDQELGGPVDDVLVVVVDDLLGVGGLHHVIVDARSELHGFEPPSMYVAPRRRPVRRTGGARSAALPR